MIGSRLLAACFLGLLCLTAGRAAAQDSAPAATPPVVQPAAQAVNPPPTAAVPSAQPQPEAPPPSNPYPSAQARRWTNEDVARVRAMLAAEHAQRQLQGPAGASKPQHVVHGDAGAALSVGLSIDTLFHDDVGFRLFKDSKATARLGLWAAYDLVTVSPHYILSGELGFGAEGNDADGLFGGTASARFRAETFHAAAILRWDATSFLAPQLRLAGGVSAVHLELNLPDEPQQTENKASGFGSLGAGVLVHTPARTFENAKGKLASLTFGILIEGGYALRSPVDFALRSGGGAHAIEVINAKLGRLDLSGPYVRVSFVARF